MAYKAYKFRIYPTEEQETLVAKTFGCVRFVYNKMLAEQKENYERFKDNKVLLKQQKFPTPAKYKGEFEWLKEVDSLALANAQLNLQESYRNFFEGRAKYPRFKTRKSRQSYTTNMVNGNIKLVDGYLKLPKLKPIKMKQHREIPSHHIIKSCTLSKTTTGKYYVSILTEYEQHAKPKEIKRVVGLDFSMSGLFVESEKGGIANYPRYYRQALEKLAKAQRILSRRQIGSNCWEKQRLKVAKLHEKVVNQRNDFLHKQSFALTQRYDAIVIEDLDMKGISQTLNFGKSVMDTAWGRFTKFLKYKLENQGKKLIKIDKWFPSSKTCSHCGLVKEALSLSERTFQCACGFVLYRDWNAAINIKKEGLRIF
ncbi:transposase [Sporosarcina sp. Marseille-Q4063]|uniref:RNA-guided endonuclease TnpB family protein n=1 Tax=Sporosarcina sp. Marseille-Q4063 TaxID=2810514 RepID=UPI001BB032D7|nr:RNA-guided endonuclease TnpB family protein [Sporosarcina sp. Marseille-Q4063]QUW20341.1 transposase [Sporosarcina sp. Marseille-Q4063]